MTLTTRLLVFFLSMLALVLIGFSAGLYLIADSYLHRQVEERLDAAINTISAAVEVGPKGVEWDRVDKQLSLDFSSLGGQMAWLVADDQGQIVDQSRGANTEKFLSEPSVSWRLNDESRRSIKWKVDSWEAGTRWIHADRPPHDQTMPTSKEQDDDDDPRYRALSITAGVSLMPVRATLGRLALVLAGLSAGIWFVAFFAGRFVCRRALMPVRRMAVAATEITADDLAQRLPTVTTKDELEDLNCAFNSLLDRLQDSFARQRRFTGDASHQLRTPLTVILGQIEVALRRERSVAEYQQVLATVQKRATYLASMVESLLFLARADSEAGFTTRQSLDLTTWLPQHLLTWSEHARANDMKIAFKSSELCNVETQPALLGELLNILLDNACKHSQPGTPITLGIERVQNEVSVKVDDQGYGIDQNDLANLFVPFFRSAEARERGIDGIGLGLSIAKRLAAALGGRLTVVSQHNQGSCFVIWLTLAEKEASALDPNG